MHLASRQTFVKTTTRPMQQSATGSVRMMMDDHANTLVGVRHDWVEVIGPGDLLESCSSSRRPTLPSTTSLLSTIPSRWFGCLPSVALTCLETGRYLAGPWAASARNAGSGTEHTSSHAFHHMQACAPRAANLHSKHLVCAPAMRTRTSCSNASPSRVCQTLQHLSITLSSPQQSSSSVFASTFTSSESAAFLGARAGSAKVADLGMEP